MSIHISNLTQKRREVLHCRSLHFLRLVGIALSVETSNAEPHADTVYNYLLMLTAAKGVDDTPMAMR